MAHGGGGRGGVCPTLCKEGGGNVRVEEMPGEYVQGGNVLHSCL